MTWIEKLKALRPCGEAVAWLESTGLSGQAAWEACERADWMLWLASKCQIDRLVLVRAACACARTALAYVTKGEDRPRIAIETAERWCDGRATIDDVRAHAAAAADAADAAHAAAADAADAAHAAAAAAADAADAADAAAADAAHAAAYTAHAAADAAHAAAAAKVRLTALRDMAAIVRQHIPQCPLKEDEQ